MDTSNPNIEVLAQQTFGRDTVYNQSTNIRFVEENRLYKLLIFVGGKFDKEIILRHHIDEQSKEQSKREYQLVCKAFE